MIKKCDYEGYIAKREISKMDHLCQKLNQNAQLRMLFIIMNNIY